MSNLSDISSITISLSGPAPSAASFTNCLLFAYFTSKPWLTKSYASLDEITTDGFATTSPVYKMAARAFGQTPKPAQVIVGRRGTAYTQTIKVTPVNVTVGYVYAFTIVSPDSTTTKDVTYTVQSGDDASDVVTGLVASAGSPTGVTVTSHTTYFTLAAAAGKVFDLIGLPLPGDMTIEDTTADPGIVADITALYAADPSSWYAVNLDWGGKATVEALAVWVEANTKIAPYTTSDSACVDPNSTTDVMAQLKASSYFRTYGLYCANQLQSYSALGWTAALLNAPGFPGSAAWFFRTIVGVTPDALQSAQDHAICGVPTQGTFGKNGSVYITQNGLGIVKGSKVAGGEWIDVIIGRDALQARIQESIFGAQKRAADNASKIPFTDDGIGMIQAATLVPLLLAEASVNGASFLVKGSSFVNVPKAAEVTIPDKQARRLTGATFGAEIAGAIYATVITGNLTP